MSSPVMVMSVSSPKKLNSFVYDMTYTQVISYSISIVMINTFAHEFIECMFTWQIRSSKMGRQVTWQYNGFTVTVVNRASILHHSRRSAEVQK